MSESAVWAVQKSMYEALNSDVQLTALLGASRIYDHVPQRATYPFLSIGQSIARDWSTSTEDGLEHELVLDIWSKAGGKKQTHKIMSVVRAVLHDSELSVVDHHLVNLRCKSIDADLDKDGETYHGIMRFRAVTEPVV